MIETLRKNPIIVRSALSLITALFCVGLFIPNPTQSSKINGKRQVNIHRTQESARILLSENPNLSQSDAQQRALQHELTRIQVANYIEDTGLVPSKRFIGNALAAQGITKDTFNQRAKDLHLTTRELQIEVADQTAQRMLLDAIAESSFSSSKHAELIEKNRQQAQRVIDIDLSSARYSVEMQTLRSFYQAMPAKPESDAAISYRYIKLATDASPALKSEIRKYAFQHPESLNAIAQQFQLSLQKYGGTPPPYLPKDLDQTTWFKRNYVSDLITDGEDTYLIQTDSYTPAKTKSFEQSLDDVKKTYIQRIILPKIIAELDATDSTASVIKKYSLKTIEKIIPPQNQRLYHGNNRTNIYTDDQTHIHWQHLDGYQAHPEAPHDFISHEALETSMFARMLLSS